MTSLSTELQLQTAARRTRHWPLVSLYCILGHSLINKEHIQMVQDFILHDGLHRKMIAHRQIQLFNQGP